jgi:hypothetical protein
MPVFEKIGNCGFHPQFAHTDNPPTGYRFIRFAPRKQKPAKRRVPSTRQKLRALAGRIMAGIIFLLRLPLGLIKHTFRRGAVRCCRVLWLAVRFFFSCLLAGAGLKAALDKARGAA